MPSHYLSSLNRNEREVLEKRLLESQNGVCFICNEPIDYKLHSGKLDIDHVEPLTLGGKDDPSNFGLTHSSCNRSKQASDLRVARTLHKFNVIREKYSNQGPNHPNLNDIFTEYKGSKYLLPIKIVDDHISYSLSDIGDVSIHSTPLYHDKLSNMNYFFTVLPIQYLFYDDYINPRGIGGSSFYKLVGEFFRKRPQLHISLGWANYNENKSGIEIKLFDGQHKAAAQILLGINQIPIRVFINPNRDVLLTTNTNAGTVLRQIAFDKSVQRHLGSNIYSERIRRYQIAHGKNEDDFHFSETDLLTYFKGEQREVKRYILDAVRNSVTHDPDNLLRDYIDFGGRKKEKPLSYSSIEKTFYSFFICRDALHTTLDYKIDIGENPRSLEKKQLVNLMNIIATEIFINYYDPDVGTYRLEKRVSEGDLQITDEHLRAYRMSREEVLYNWLQIIQKIIIRYYLLQGNHIDDKKLFQYPFPEPLWDSINRVVRNLARLSIWKNHDLGLSVFGGKQNYAYWHSIFETGQTLDSAYVMSGGINLDDLLKE